MRQIISDSTQWAGYNFIRPLCWWTLAGKRNLKTRMQLLAMEETNEIGISAGIMRASLSLTHTHTYTHTLLFSLKHTDTITHSLTHTQIQSHTLPLFHSLSHTHTHIYPRAEACSLTLPHTHTHMPPPTLPASTFSPSCGFIFLHYVDF